MCSNDGTHYIYRFSKYLHFFTPLQEYILNVDDEVCLLLIQKKLTSFVVPTILYKPLLNYILNNLHFGTIKEIAADLKNNGYYCEAASLLCTGRNAPANLTTFDSAVGLLKRWL